jgi:uncharacterized OsmC-like protein
MSSATESAPELTPLEQSDYPLAFVASAGAEMSTGTQWSRPESSFRCEVMGLGRFQKEGLVTDAATGRSWRLPADEGKYLRGTDKAPAPLSHWGAGLHSDLTSRIARIAAHRAIPLTRLSVTVTQGFGSHGSFARGEALGLVGNLTWTINVTSRAQPEKIETIVAEALLSSPANAALVKDREGTFALYTNSRPTPVVGVLQSRAAAEEDPFRRHAGRPEPVGGAVVRVDLLTRKPSPGAQAVELSDDQSGAIRWHVRATGDYQFGSDLVASTVDFPGVGASEWTLLSDDTGRRAPSPLAYFSIGTAFCYHTQLCRYVDVRRLPVSNPRLVQSSVFMSDGDESDAAPLDTHLYVNGAVDDAQTASLLAAAANTCYAHRALAVKVTSSRNLEITTV